MIMEQISELENIKIIIWDAVTRMINEKSVNEVKGHRVKCNIIMEVSR